MSSKFKFKYDLPETGKAIGYFAFGKKELHFDALNVCNPLADMLKAMVNLIHEPSHLWGEENNVAIEWYSEDCIFVLEISSPDGKKIHFTFTKSSAPFGAEVPPVKIEGKLPLQEFYLQIIIELDLFIKRLGLLNYHQNWQNDEFPLTFFLILKKYLINWKVWIPSKEEADILESEFMMILS